MPAEHHDEAELVRAAQIGEREAFAQLYESHAERIYRYVLARVSLPADAEDVTAEVFLRAMKGLRSYKMKGIPFIAWLFRIAHNEAVNFLKKRTRRGEMPLLESAAVSDDLEDKAIRQVESGEVKLAMKHLTDLQNQVLSLRFAGELSITETANAMDRSEGAVKFLQHSALRSLRRILEQQQVGSHGG